MKEPRVRRVPPGLWLCFGFAMMIAITTTLQAQPPRGVLNELGRWPGWNRTGLSCIQVRNNIAYAGGHGLQIYDVSDPTREVHIGQLERMGIVYGIDVAGNLAYLAAPMSGLWIVDVSNPRAPNPLGALVVSGFPRHVEVSGTIAYLVSESSYVDGVKQTNGGLHVIDVKDPTRPTQLATLPYQYASEVRISGSTAYLQANSRVDILDVTDPAHPVLRGSLDARYGSLALSGSRLFIAGNQLLKVFDITSPWYPALTSSISAPANCVAVEGDLVVAGYDNKELATFRLSGAGSLTPLGALGGFGTTKLMIANQRAFCWDIANGFSIVDLTLPAAPVQLGTLGLEVDTKDVRVAGGIAYLTERRPWASPGANGALEIFDVRDPTHPTRLGGCNIPLAGSVRVAGSRAYVQSGDRTIQILDVANPTQPAVVGSFTASRSLRSWTATTNRLYVSAESADFRILDVTTASNPVLLGTNAIGCNSMELVGTNLFTSAMGLYIYDVSRPAQVRRVGWGALGDWSHNETITVQGNRAFIGSNGDGYYNPGNSFLIFDIANLTKPAYLGQCSVSVDWDLTRIAIVGEVAFVSEQIGGIDVIYLADPQKPVSVFRFNLGAPVSALTTEGSFLYAAIGSEGFRVFKMSPPLHQTITFEPIGPQRFPGTGLQVRVEASSGMPVSLSRVSGPAFLQGRHVTLTGTGNITLRAVQAGGVDFLPASAEITFSISEAPPSSPPTLFSQIEWNQLVMLWPLSAPYSALESTPTLSPPAWTPANATSSIVGSYTRFALPRTNTQSYFRLRL